ncbi:MAG: hypothetical protein HQK65_15310 [Desulfamplus sp.]|nr:hypothetical protein [Desulfamplus sp.]
MDKQLPVVKKPQMLSVPKSKEIQSSFNADQKLEMAKNGFELAGKIVELAHLWMEGKEQAETRKDENEKILLEIQKIDSEAEAIFRKAEASVLNEKQRTERMGIFCQLLEKKDFPPDLVETILLECMKIDSK